MATTATISRLGLAASLLPREPHAAIEARSRVGAGIVLSVGHGSGRDPTRLPLPFDRIEEVGKALAALAQFRTQRLYIDPPPDAAVMAMLDAWRVPVATDADSDALWVTCWDQTPHEALVSIADQLAKGARQHSAVHALVNRARHCEDERSFGIGKLLGLAGYRAAYGSGRARALRQALGDALTRITNSNDGTRFVLIEDGILFVTSVAEADGILDRLKAQFQTTAGLHYRRQDREQGFIRLGSGKAPLVSLETRSLPASASDAEVLEALGMVKSER